MSSDPVFNKILNILEKEENKGWTVSLYIPVSNPIKGSLGFMANISIHTTLLEAENKAKALTLQLDNPDIIFHVRPWKSLYEIDNTNSLVEITGDIKTDNIKEQMEKDRIKREKIADIINEQMSKETVPYSPAHVSQLIYNITLLTHKLKLSEKVTRESQKSLAAKKLELDKIVEKVPAAKETWKLETLKFLTLCEEEATFQDMLQVFNSLYQIG